MDFSAKVLTSVFRIIPVGHSPLILLPQGTNNQIIRGCVRLHQTDSYTQLSMGSYLRLPTNNTLYTFKVLYITSIKLQTYYTSFKGMH